MPFILAAPGVLVLVLLLDFDGDDMLKTVVVKTGIALVVLGVVYGTYLVVVLRMRERRGRGSSTAPPRVRGPR